MCIIFFSFKSLYQGNKKKYGLFYSFVWTKGLKIYLDYIFVLRKNSNFALGDLLFSCFAIQKTKSINLPFDSATKKYDVEKNSGDGANLGIICVRCSVQHYTLKGKMWTTLECSSPTFWCIMFI